MIGRGEAAGADARAYWAGGPDLAQRRRPVPPHRPVPALRLRPVDAAAVRAVGPAAVGRRLVRLARRRRSSLLLWTIDWAYRRRPLATAVVVAPAGLPDRRQPRHRQHQPAAHAHALGRPVQRAAPGRPPVGARDLDEVGPGRSSCSSSRRGPALWGLIWLAVSSAPEHRRRCRSRSSSSRRCSGSGRGRSGSTTSSSCGRSCPVVATGSVRLLRPSRSGRGASGQAGRLRAAWRADRALAKLPPAHPACGRTSGSTASPCGLSAATPAAVLRRSGPPGAAGARP